MATNGFLKDDGERCPYMIMYEREGAVKFHNKDRLFAKCRSCIGYGFHYDPKKGEYVKCPDYPQIMQARNWVRQQRLAAILPLILKNRTATAAAGD